MADGSALAVQLAVNEVGRIPYVWGRPLRATGNHLKSADCSGLAMWIYWHAFHKKLIHSAATQYTQLRHRPVDEAQPGDLLFLRAGGIIHHVAIYIGNGRTVEAADPRDGIRFNTVDNMRSSGLVKYAGAHPGSTGAAGMVAASANTRSTVAQYIYQFWRSKGFSIAGAAAATANAEVESGFNPDSTNPREGAIGIYQWELGRRTQLQQFAAAHGTSERDLQTQLEFAYQEVNQRGLMRAFATSNNPHVAAATWDIKFEGSSGSTREQRESDAVAIFQRVSKGRSLIGGRYGQTATLTGFTPPGGWGVTGGLAGGPAGAIAGGIFGGGNPVTNIENEFKGLASLLSWLTNKHNWERIGLMAMGIVILIFAVIKITGTGDDIRDAAMVAAV